MNKREAKQTAHAIVANVIRAAMMEDIIDEDVCGDAPQCGPCKRCLDAERIREAMWDIHAVHDGLGEDHRQLK